MFSVAGDLKIEAIVVQVRWVQEIPIEFECV